METLCSENQAATFNLPLCRHKHTDQSSLCTIDVLVHILATNVLLFCRVVVFFTVVSYLNVWFLWLRKFLQDWKTSVRLLAGLKLGKKTLLGRKNVFAKFKKRMYNMEWGGGRGNICREKHYNICIIVCECQRDSEVLICVRPPCRFYMMWIFLKCYHQSICQLLS